MKRVQVGLVLDVIIMKLKRRSKVINWDYLEEKEYDKLLELDNILSEFGLSGYERSEIYNECSIRDIEELVKELEEEL